jgi:hypothetical protein
MPSLEKPQPCSQNAGKLTHTQKPQSRSTLYFNTLIRESSYEFHVECTKKKKAKRMSTRRPPRDTAQQQSSTRSGFLQLQLRPALGPINNQISLPHI